MISRQEERDRECVLCEWCNLFQYRTKNGFCRRCSRFLPPRAAAFILPPASVFAKENAPTLQSEVIKNIGPRIRALRESRGLTQGRFQVLSRISRSYVSRIESGQMTPSLGTLEKVAEALEVQVNYFFRPASNGEVILADPFIRKLRPYLRQLDFSGWAYVLKILRALAGDTEQKCA